MSEISATKGFGCKPPSTVKKRAQMAEKNFFNNFTPTKCLSTNNTVRFTALQIYFYKTVNTTIPSTVDHQAILKLKKRGYITISTDMNAITFTEDGLRYVLNIINLLARTAADELFREYSPPRPTAYQNNPPDFPPWMG